MNKVRNAAVAGKFYSGNERELRNDIEKLLESASNKKEYENIFGLVCPHAGYIYSGKTAAFAYNTIKNKTYKTVVVISPSHYEYFRGSSIYDGDGYETPLGVVTIDIEMRDKLITQSDLIFSGEKGHGQEHALEVQLPFLQTVLNNFRVLPIVIGDQRENFVYELAEKLADVIDDRTLIVASSDLSHFYSKEQAQKLDSVVDSNISNFNYQKLMQDLEMENCFACGGGGIVSLMKAAELKNINNAEVLSRTDSGDVSGDNTGVVGYLSAVIF